MNLENESSQSQKATYDVILFMQNDKNRYIYRDRKWTGGCLGQAWGAWGLLGVGDGDEELTQHFFSGG